MWMAFHYFVRNLAAPTPGCGVWSSISGGVAALNHRLPGPHASGMAFAPFVETALGVRISEVIVQMKTGKVHLSEHTNRGGAGRVDFNS
jgi:hypothetical protein